MEIQITDKIFLKLDEYNGSLSITQCYKNKSGDLAPEMVRVRNFETGEYTDKRAKAVYLGKGEEGRANALLLADIIQKMYGGKAQSQQEDVPF